jgi:Arc/MetJ-type ribon-helix-helix transcriptional regulator
MKSNAKSSITLPAEELKQVESLRKSLKAKSNVEVIRRGLTLLSEQTHRQKLRAAYQNASDQTRESVNHEIKELDGLTGEGLEK